MPVVEFKKIECDFLVFNITDLSADQQYLNDICIAVNTGDCPMSLSKP